MSFPTHRPRRLRSSLAWRRAVRETDLDGSRADIGAHGGQDAWAD